AMLLDRHQRPLEVEAELLRELPAAVHNLLWVSRGAQSHGAEGGGAEAVARRKARDVDDGIELYRGDRSASLFAAQQLVDLVFDLLQVHEGTVDGGKPDVGDFIEAAQLVHHQLAHLARRNLHLSAGSELSLDLVHHALDGAGRDFTFGRGFHQAAEQFLAVEVLAPAILLHDIQRHRLDAFVGGEPLRALQALATPADRLPGVGVPGVDHLEVDMTTIGTLHLTPVSQILWSGSNQ